MLLSKMAKASSRRSSITRRVYQLKSRYGLSSEEYDQMVKDQMGCFYLPQRRLPLSR